MPRDKITQAHQGYAFCEFDSQETADYAVRMTNMIKLYGKQIRVNKVIAANSYTWLVQYAIRISSPLLAIYDFVHAQYSWRVPRCLRNPHQLISSVFVYQAAADQGEQQDQGFQANIFVGNLDPEVDEKMLYDCFSAFGAVLSAKVTTIRYSFNVRVCNERKNTQYLESFADTPCLGCGDSILIFSLSTCTLSIVRKQLTS